MDTPKNYIGQSHVAVFSPPKRELVDPLQGTHSLPQIEAAKQEALQRIEGEKRKRQTAVMDKIRSVMWAEEVSLDMLVAYLGGSRTQKRRSGKAKPKYRDPVSGALWSGRGREPNWIKGKDRVPFLIKP